MSGKATEPKTIIIFRFTIDGQAYTLPMNNDVGFGLTPREAGRVRRLSDAVGLEIIRRGGEGDVEVLVALGIVAMERAGVTVNEDALWNGTSEFHVEADEPIPPPSAAAAASDTSPTTSTILEPTGSRG